MENARRSTIWVSYAIATLFLSYQYVLRVLPNILMPDLMSKFKVSAGPFGEFSGIYYLGYILMHIPLGIVIDKYGTKWVLPVSMILTGAGLLPMVYADQWPAIIGDQWNYAIWGRFLTGVGSSAAVLGLFKIIKIGFGDEKFSIMLGISVTFGLLGAVYGGQPVGYLLEVYPWQNVLIVFALFGVGLSVVSFLTTPSQKGLKADTSGLVKDVLSIITNPKIISICFLGGLMLGPLEGFADVWGSQFLRTVYHFESSQANLLPSLIFLGMCFGASFLSYLASKTKAYYEIIFLAASIMAANFILILTGKMSFQVMTILFFVTGVMCAYQILVIYKATTFASGHLVSVTSACANMVIMSFGYFFHKVIGGLMEYHWDGTVKDDVIIYQSEAYITSISIIPICLLIASFGFLYVMIKHRRSNSIRLAEQNS